MATPKQVLAIGNLFSGVESKRLQKLQTSGLLTDVRDCDIDNVSRAAVQKALKVRAAPTKQQRDGAFPRALTLMNRSVDYWAGLFDGQGISVSDNAWSLLNDMPMTTLRRVYLTVVTPRELGLVEWVTQKEFYAAARKADMSLCPPVLAPNLRSVLREPVADTVSVAMRSIYVVKSIDGAGQRRFVLHAEPKENWYRLGAESAHPDNGISPDAKFVFVVRA